MRLINEKGEQIGVMSTQEAINLAEEESKDVILIAMKADPPVAKLIEYSKHKYQQQQKKQAAKKSAKKSDIKELRLSPFIADGDLDSRIDRVKEFLEDGYKIRLQVRFKGRQITRKEFGYKVIEKITNAVADNGQLEMEPKLQGKVLTAQLMPKK